MCGRLIGFMMSGRAAYIDRLRCGAIIPIFASNRSAVSPVALMTAGMGCNSTSSKLIIGFFTLSTTYVDSYMNYVLALLGKTPRFNS